jgi:hypothetical protein
VVRVEDDGTAARGRKHSKKLEVLATGAPGPLLLTSPSSLPTGSRQGPVEPALSPLFWEVGEKSEPQDVQKATYTAGTADFFEVTGVFEGARVFEGTGVACAGGSETFASARSGLTASSRTHSDPRRARGVSRSASRDESARELHIGTAFAVGSLGMPLPGPKRLRAGLNEERVR